MWIPNGIGGNYPMTPARQPQPQRCIHSRVCRFRFVSDVDCDGLLSGDASKESRCTSFSAPHTSAPTPGEKCYIITEEQVEYIEPEFPITAMRIRSRQHTPAPEVCEEQDACRIPAMCPEVTLAAKAAREQVLKEISESLETCAFYDEMCSSEDGCLGHRNGEHECDGCSYFEIDGNQIRATIESLRQPEPQQGAEQP